MTSDDVHSLLQINVKFETSELEKKTPVRDYTIHERS